MTVAIACDHAGFRLKKFLMEKLGTEEIVFNDYGTFSEEPVDYPDMIHPLARDVSKGIVERAVILCGSGNGVAITANKYPNVRAALCWNEEVARQARQHNNANVLSLPARFISEEEGLKLAQIFLHTDFEGGRHLRRVEKISSLI